MTTFHTEPSTNLADEGLGGLVPTALLGLVTMPPDSTEENEGIV